MIGIGLWGMLYYKYTTDFCLGLKVAGLLRKVVQIMIDNECLDELWDDRKLNSPLHRKPQLHHCM